MTKRTTTPSGIDIEYLRRCKQMTPGQRLDWLAAAWEFVRGVEKAGKKGNKTKQEYSL